jgi:predicted metal-dependent HD superfamily phosphohydrolase
MAVELAIFFHDWVYEPLGLANEAESVAEFEAFATELGIEEGLRGRVRRLVEATVKHRMGEDVPESERMDLGLFLDFDLEVLGRGWEEYLTYANQIRIEYSYFGEQEYAKGRANVLRGFLERERLYFSEAFHQEKENVARENISREIERLDSTIH